MGKLSGSGRIFGTEIPTFEDRLEPITAEQIKEVLWYLPDGKAKGADSWTPAELRVFDNSHLRGLADFMNRREEEGTWPSNMGGAHHCFDSQKRGQA